MEAVFLTFILMLSIFLGFELINKVPSTLHTPLMSGSNAISGITLVGALSSAGGGFEQLATILGVAQALGETAPLLLIGMSAFVASVPATPFDQSTALPVQIYLWQGNELRNFFEGRTSAAIVVLLALMLTLNSMAIWLRKRFEVRW